jgi:peptide/nickel transport system substrate-binding protein
MKKIIRYVSLIIALSVFSTLLLSGCATQSANTGSTGSTASTQVLAVTKAAETTSGQTTADAGKSAQSKTLTVALSSDARGIKPANAYDHTSNAVILQVLEGLFAYNEKGEVVPVLAKSYKQVDATTYVYQIRDDVTFSDGTPLTADDVVFSLNYHKDPAVASELAWIFAKVDTIEKTGDWEVTVKLTEPDALWSKALATTAGLVFSKAYYEANKDTFGTPEGNVVGSGPYVLQKWVSGSEIDLSKNKNYWDKTAKLPFDSIVYKVITDDTTRYEALKAGQVDLAYDLPYELSSEAEKSSDLHAIYADSYATKYLTFNTKVKPFDDVNVRKAIYYAVDRSSILTNVVKKIGSPANSLLIDSTFTGGVTDLWSSYIAAAPDYTYNLATAKEYLAKSSVPGGFSFTLTYKDTALNNSIALLIQQSLQGLNIKVTLNKVTADEFAADKFGGNFTSDGIGKFDVLIDNWGSDFPDPDGNLTPLYLSTNAGVAGGSNDAGYSNPDLDKLILAASASTDTNARATLLQQAYSIASEEVPYAALYYQKTIFVLNNRIDAKISASWLYNLYYKDFKIVE